MRALSHEIAADLPPVLEEVPPESKQHAASLHLSTLEPLLDVVADMPDEALLRSLAEFKSHVQNYNDLLVSTNAMHIADTSPEVRRGVDHPRHGSI